MESPLSQQSAIDTISEWCAKPDNKLVFYSSHRERELYLQAVATLQQTRDANHFGELITKALTHLKREFQVVLSREADFPGGASSTTEWSTSNTVTDSTSDTLRYEDFTGYVPIPNNDAINYLRSVAKIMNLNGDLGKCVNVYKSVRNNFFQSLLKPINFDELKIGENLGQIEGMESKRKIGVFIQVLKLVLVFFEKEKRLCVEIFDCLGENSVIDECFVGTVQDVAVGLFAFAQAVSTGKQPYERMEHVLCLYNVFWLLLPDVHALFGSESGERIRNAYNVTLVSIENDVGRILRDLEMAVFNELPTHSDDKGGVCQTTKFVMKQIGHIVIYKEMLNNMIKSSPLLDLNGSSTIRQEDLGDTHNRSFLDLHLILIIVALQKNLAEKSKSYKEVPLRHLFIMNNVHYIVQKIEGSYELKPMIGDPYLLKLQGNVDSAMNGYHKLTCDKFLTCLQDVGICVTLCFKWGMSKSALKRRLKPFNEVFDEIKNIHTTWTVTDPQLKDRIRVAMSTELVQAYKNFLGKFTSNPEIEKKYIKYSVQDLEKLVLEKLFACT